MICARMNGVLMPKSCVIFVMPLGAASAAGAAGAGRCRFQLDARIAGQLGERGFVVERNIPFDGLQREGAIHGSTFQVGIAKLAGQARGDGALAHAGGSVDGDDELARFKKVHRDE